MNVLLQLLYSLPMTLLLWVAAQLLGLLLAIPVAAARMSRNTVFRVVAMWWIEIFRGIPTLVLLFIVFFGLAASGFSLTAIVASILALGFSSSAYQAETIRSGFEAVPRQQYEAALALSLPLYTRLRKVLLPQAMPVIIEGMLSYAIHLLKETALASLIGVVDVMAVASYLVERGVNGPTVFAIAGVIYLLLCLVLAGMAKLASNRITAGTRKVRAA